jgi:hypothetical protein
MRHPRFQDSSRVKEWRIVQDRLIDGPRILNEEMVEFGRNNADRIGMFDTRSEGFQERPARVGRLGRSWVSRALLSRPAPAP